MSLVISEYPFGSCLLEAEKEHCIPLQQWQHLHPCELGIALTLLMGMKFC